ncbi:MAG: glycoside-pentoside-hexuronide (GPH):cation symporter [Propionibacteriaceae bacterium]|jgi:GPH family glycoside/pentoside/hexuronide:cation symporter/probable glucitol transport protein GutA|nr:glycoside-pentoside-hexuronide (GPH):cation symporter [Propionibacteriaceae bacterium]
MSTQTAPVIDKDAKLSFLTKVAYGCGDIASQFVWTFVGGYLTVFFTDVVGLAPAVVAAILLGARIWDGVNDPMFGAIAERTKTKYGRFRPYIIYLAPACALFNVLTFTNPGFGGNETMRVVYATITYVVLGMLYTAVNLSYASLGGAMTYDPVERTELVSYRIIGTNVGSVVINLITMPLILYFSGAGDGKTVNATGYTLTTIVYCVLSLPLFYFMVAKCKEVVVPINKKKIPIRTSLKVVLTNPPLIVAFFGSLFMMTAFFGRIGVVVYYYRYVLERMDLVGILMMLPSLFGPVTLIAFMKVVDKVGKKWMCMISFLCCAACLIAIYCIDPKENLTLLLILTALFGMSNFGNPIKWSMVPEAVDYAEDKTGVRADGISYAVLSLSTKFGSAFGASIGLLIMGAMGYEANKDQSVEALQGINIAANLLPAGLFIIAAIITVFYPLNTPKVLAIRDSLAAKAALAEAAAATATEEK